MPSNWLTSLGYILHFGKIGILDKNIKNQKSGFSSMKFEIRYGMIIL